MTRRTSLLGAAALLPLAGMLWWTGCGGGETAEIVTDVAVHTGSIIQATLRRYVTAYGYVEPEAGHDGTAAAGAILAPLTPGVLAEIHAVEGRAVTRGTVLFRLDSRMALVSVKRAEQEVAFAEQAWQRQKLLLPADGTSERAVQESQRQLDDARGSLAAARTALAYLEVAAPMSGTVVQLDARIGQSVDASSVLARIVDLDRLVISADVPVREAAGLTVGQRVFLGPDSTALRGTIQTLGREVDRSTGSYRVRVAIPPRAGLLPGQFTDIRILAGEHRDVLVIPEAGLVTREGQGSWIVVVEGGIATRRAVTTGLRENGLIEIRGDRLTPGMTIVTLEAYSLPEKTKVHPVGR